ncbi:MAG: guanylate kinase [Gammaproteobacteria bacterium]|nr:guanylate kinase [Gammaproteobacteria bacterium]|tara:strand:+ start:2780 stop:3415 length:636 start_codon:yes stop_codon:yes gene_type:complete
MLSDKKIRPASLFVFAAPSGAGKTTLVHALMTKHSDDLRFSISYTTRKPRSNEADGVDYLFIDVKKFMDLRKSSELLEHAEVFGNYYATSRSQVEAHLSKKLNVVLEIDWQGAQQVRKSMPECITIFIMPPSIKELARRLRERRTDKPKIIERRLKDAKGDMSHWDEFDYVVVNENLNDAIIDLESILNGTGDDLLSSNNRLRDRVKNILN